MSNKVDFVFWLWIFLLISEDSADFDGCCKLKKRKKKNITFFEILEINLWNLIKN